MNLTPSIGAGARAAVPSLEPVPADLDGSDAKRRRPSPANDMTTTELILRFAWWAHQLHRFPSMAQIRDHFNVDRATAYRWRSALANAHGIVPPQDTAATEEGD